MPHPPQRLASETVATHRSVPCGRHEDRDEQEEHALRLAKTEMKDILKRIDVSEASWAATKKDMKDNKPKTYRESPT